jgi:glucan phosphorylase
MSEYMKELLPQIIKITNEIYYDLNYTHPSFTVLDRMREYHEDDDPEIGSLLEVIIEDNETKDTYLLWCDKDDETNCDYEKVTKKVIESIVWEKI